MLLLATALVFTSCSDDDDDGTPIIVPTGELTVADQPFENNMLTISTIGMSEPGWVVIHRDNGSDAPVVPDIISKPKYVEAGSFQNVTVELKEGVTLEDGEPLWAMLHTDDGDKVYEFDGGTVDAPITYANGSIVMKSFVVNVEEEPSLTVDDQALINNSIMVESITVAQDGWVVVHADNGDAPQVPDIISQPVYLPAGTYSEVEIPFTNDANIEANDQVWVMLHSDTDTEAVYEFDGGEEDPPIMVDGEILMTEITITDVVTEDVSATILEVSDQALVDNTITIDNIFMVQDGWVVVHADNNGAPQVPEIISEPVYLEAGQHSDVEINFESSADLEVGDTVWVMIHNDTGLREVYEFDGIGLLDLPVFIDGTALVTAIEITE